MNRSDLYQRIEAAQDHLKTLLQFTEATPLSRNELSQEIMAGIDAVLEELCRVSVSSHIPEHVTNLNPSLESLYCYYKELFDQAPASYLLTDATGLIQEVNQATIRLLGGEHGSLVGKPLTDFVADKSLEPLSLVLSQLRQDAAVQTTEVSLKSQDDKLLYVILSVNAVYGTDQQLLGFRWLLYDITDRKQAEIALRDRVEQEQRVGAIAQRLRQSLNPQEILDNTVAEVRQFLQADRVVVYRSETNGPTIAVAEAVEQGWCSLLGTTVDPAWAKERTVYYHQWGLYAVDDLEKAVLPPHSQEVLRRGQVKALLVIPIMQNEQFLGLLCVHQCSRARRWQSSELEVLRQLAENVAVTLQQSERYQHAQRLNIDLEHEVQRRTAEVQRAFEFESMLKRITDKVRDSLDESQILETAVRELTLVLGLSGCNAALYDLDQGTSTIHYEYTSSIPTSQGRVARMDHFPEIYRQLQQGYYFQFCSLIPNPARGQVAMLACPIFVDPDSSQGIDQAVLGDLWLINHKDYVFNEFEIRLVRQVANQCAIAIRQARLYQAAQVQVQELERLNRLKDEFLSTVSHELRTPISNVKMAIHMLRTATTEEKRQRYLEILEAESTREAELINDLLDLQRLEDACYPIALEVVKLQDLLPGIVEPFRARAFNHQQKLQVSWQSDLSPIASDMTILRRILAELLNNACKYTIPSGEIHLTVHQDQLLSIGPVTVFTIRNQAEIPRSELPHIFEKFYRVPNADPWRQGGTGLGLALVQKLIEQSGGVIRAESTDGWTTFTVKLPTHIQAET